MTHVSSSVASVPVSVRLAGVEFGVSRSGGVRIDRGGVAFTLQLSPVKLNA